MLKFIDKDSKMADIAENLAKTFLTESGENDIIPFVKVACSDNICSAVLLSGSFDEYKTWQNGIFHNSRYFLINIFPSPKQRYYSGGNVSVEMSSSHGVGKFRTANNISPEKAIAKIQKWIIEQL